MAKRNNRVIEIDATETSIGEVADKLKRLSGRPYDIMGAQLKDGYCNYDVKVVLGQMNGERSTVNGPLIVSQDLREAFRRLNVHLAIIDQAFAHAKEDVQNIAGARPHELVYEYMVDAIKIKGADERIKVSIAGTKALSTVSGRMKCETPYILLDAGTDYKWYNELLEDVENLRREVELYREGKGEQPERRVKKSKKNKNQTAITDPDQVHEQEFGETVTL